MQYPNKHGEICDYTSVINSAKQNECLVTFAADLLSLTILTPPKKLGADIVVGSSQRFEFHLDMADPMQLILLHMTNLSEMFPAELLESLMI